MSDSGLSPLVPDGRDPFMGFALDEASCAALVRAAAERGWSDATVMAGDVRTAAGVLASLPTPAILVVDVSESADPVVDLNRLAEVCDPGTRVLAIGAVNDVDLFRRLRDAGIEDYLVKPVGAGTLAAALARAAEPTERSSAAAPAAEAEKGRLAVVIGARGGVGATTVAVNLAWLAANRLARRTALVDMDLVFGGVALALDLDPGRGFREALESPSRIDDLFLDRALVKDGPNLSVLAAEDKMDKSAEVDPEAAAVLIARLQKSFDLVVVELPRHLIGTLAEPLGNASAAVVVTDLSLAGMRDTLRLLRFFKERAPRARLLPVVGRLAPAKAAALSRDDFEKGIDAALFEMIAQDDKATTDSAAQGKPLAAVAAGGKAGPALLRLARTVADVEAEATSTSWWRRWVKG